MFVGPSLVIPDGVYVVRGAILLLVVALFVGALISVVTSRRYTGGGKFLWVAVIFFAPFLGPIAWFIAGRKAQIRTDTR